MGSFGAMADEEGRRWNTDVVPRVLQILLNFLPHRDLPKLLLLNPSCYRALASHPPFSQVIDLHEMTNAGERLIAALSITRYRQVKQINLEFARDVEDKHLICLKNQLMDSLQNLKSLNLNGCRKISDIGLEAISSACLGLETFSIYWNVRITDLGIKHLVTNCKKITQLNLSGCKGISDESLLLIGVNYKNLEALNLTRCVKLTDDGLQHILINCSHLQSLNLYALSSFTDASYKKLALLTWLNYLDLCGSQNLSDEALKCISKCRNLVSLNLTWCVHVTDMGVIALALGCTSLKFLSLFGIVGVTNKCLEALSVSCSRTLTTLDVNGCVGIKKRSREELLQLFPNLKCFKVHS